MALAFLWCWQEVLEKDPLLACSGVPRAGLDQDGDMGRDRDRGMGRDRDRALFSPIRHSRISALLSRVSVREPTCGWLSTWIFPGAEAPGHLF